MPKASAAGEEDQEEAGATVQTQTGGALICVCLRGLAVGKVV